jgi:hypothetical protein
MHYTVQRIRRSEWTTANGTRLAEEKLERLIDAAIDAYERMPAAVNFTALFHHASAVLVDTFDVDALFIDQ